MFDINTTQGYFLNLAKCALKGEQPAEKPSEVDFEAVYNFALQRSAVGLVWHSIKKLNNKPDPEKLREWYLSYSVNTLYLTASQEIELEKLISEFTDRGYDVMPLKGSQICSYYPSPDMRTKGDIDLLVKTDMSQQARDKVKQIMLEIGYEIDILNDGQVDGYKGPNKVYVEIHFEFMDPIHPNYEHFIIDWEKLEKKENSKHYSMSLVDLYYYNIGHFAKNMAAKGNSFRAVADTYVMWKELSSAEKAELNRRFEKINLKKLNDALVYISEIWFDDKHDDSTTQNLQVYLLENSVYGFEKNLAIFRLLQEHSDAKKSAYQHIIGRFFPNADELYRRYNIKNKNSLILPFLWLWRIFSLPFISKEKREKIKEEVNDVNAVSDKEIDFFKSVYNDFGLENYYN